MLEVVLKEEEGLYIPNYNMSEDFKYVDTESPKQKEISSHVSNNCEETNAIKSIEKRFQCWICDHRSKRPSDLFRHVKEVHLKCRSHHCGICGYSTYRTYNMRIHMVTAHKANKNICQHFKNSSPEVVGFPQKMNHHIEPQNVRAYFNKMMSSQIDKIFYCSFCHLRTKWAGSLRNHIYAVHMKMKPHSCPSCNYKSSKRYSIIRHIKAIHMKDRPHLCPFCPYKATRADALKIHMKRLHTDSVLTVGNS